MFTFGAENNKNLLGVVEYTIDYTVDICELLVRIPNLEFAYTSVRGSSRKKRKDRNIDTYKHRN
jgi:hypothetical protein